MFKSAMLKNEKGFTLIEMMIAGVIALAVLGGSIYVFSKQDKLLRQENARTDLRALGRLAMTELTTEIRRAGYGYPNGAGIFEAQANTLTFYANTFDTDLGTAGVQEAYTSGTADIAGGATTIAVADGSAFSAGNTIVIFDASGTVTAPWEGDTVASATATQITVSSGAPSALLFENGIVINQYQTIVYAFDAVNGLLTVSIDGGAVIPVIPLVTALSFTYFDATDTVIPYTDFGPPPTLTTAEMALIRKIVISLTLTNALDSTVTLNLNTDIDIRNNG